jgi:F-type H+-transporting ATPase subunit b
MPQFDIFSFFSQLFWVFVGFILLYLTLSFYLLPALATTLKIRKRKLAQNDSISNSSNLAVDSNTLADSTKSFVSLFNSKISTFETTALTLLSTKLELNLIALKAEAYRQFNFSIISKAQLTAIFYN